MIEKDPKNRYAACADVMRDLAALGLVNDSLSFIAAADKSTLGRMSTSAPSSVAAPAKASGAVPRSSAEDAAKKETADVSQKTYIIQHTDKAGKPQIKKLTSAQVMQAIRDGVIDSKAKAKTSAQGEWVPLAQVREFTALLEKKAVAARAEQKAGSLKEQFAKIDKQYQRRGLVKFFQNMLTNVKGIISLVIYLAIIGGIGYGAWTYGLPLLKSMTNKPDASAPAAPGGAPGATP
jgi:hypothetical protein